MFGLLKCLGSHVGDLTICSLGGVSNGGLNAGSKFISLGHERVGPLPCFLCLALRLCTEFVNLTVNSSLLILNLQYCSSLQRLDLDTGGLEQILHSSLCRDLHLPGLTQKPLGLRFGRDANRIRIVSELFRGVLGLASALSCVILRLGKSRIGLISLLVCLVTELLSLFSESPCTILRSLESLRSSLLGFGRHGLEVLELCLSKHDLSEPRLGSLLSLIEKAQCLLFDVLSVGSCLIAKGRGVRGEAVSLFLGRFSGSLHLTLGLGHQVFNSFRRLLVSGLYRTRRGRLGHEKHLLDAFFPLANGIPCLRSRRFDIELSTSDKGVSLDSDLVGRGFRIGDDLHRLLLDPSQRADRIDFHTLLRFRYLSLCNQSIDLVPDLVAFVRELPESPFGIVGICTHLHGLTLGFLDDVCSFALGCVKILRKLALGDANSLENGICLGLGLRLDLGSVLSRTFENPIL